MTCLKACAWAEGVSSCSARTAISRAHRELQLHGEVLKESEGERGTIDGFNLLVDEEHRHSREELVGAERLDKADEEADATVSRYMAGRVGEDVEELLEV